MGVNKEDLLTLVEELSLSDHVKLSDIPNIDLYMDQLLTFLDDNLAHLARNEKDKIITKTMINNYAKDGMIAAPVNKKYNSRHVIMLILTYYLKQILPLTDIKALFAPILNNINTDEDDIISLEDIYATFLKIRKIEFEDFSDVFTEKFDLIREQTSNLEKDNQDLAEIFLTIITLAAQAGAQKRLAEKMIDKYFKDAQDLKGKFFSRLKGFSLF